MSVPPHRRFNLINAQAKCLYMAITRRTQIFSISIEECHWLENLVFGFEKIVRTSGAYDPVDVDNR